MTTAQLTDGGGIATRPTPARFSRPRVDWYRLTLHGSHAHASSAFDVLSRARLARKRHIVGFHVTPRHAHLLWETSAPDASGCLEVLKTTYHWETGSRLRHTRIRRRSGLVLDEVRQPFDRAARDSKGRIVAAGVWSPACRSDRLLMTFRLPTGHLMVHTVDLHGRTIEETELTPAEEAFLAPLEF